MKTLRAIFFSLFLASAAVWIGGCATDDPDSNLAQKPWNEPQGWEGPLPSSINQGR